MFARPIGTAAILLVFQLTAPNAEAQFAQQGPKLVGTGAVGGAFQGICVSVSADGNSAVVGGPADNGTPVGPGPGAAWVYVRSGGAWSQQGAKLVGTGAVGGAQQGNSVSMSADGNTAVVGGEDDNSEQGAAWVYVRSGGVWSQQGAKLVGTGAVGAAYQGSSVSVSADGNTVVVGGIGDNGFQGAAWVYVRSGGMWSQQGAKLVGTGAVGAAYQGTSVSVSADGNTAVVGGAADNGNQGAVWVYVRSDGVWSPQGEKLVGTGAMGTAGQGGSVSVSADGNTAIEGGWFDNGYQGAAWVFVRSGGVWSQQGDKLVGTDAVGAARQGVAVSVSADGNTAVVGGYVDNNKLGATWVYLRSGGVWSQQGAKLVGTGAFGNETYQGGSVSVSADGKTVVVGGWGDHSYQGAVWVFAFQAATGVTGTNPAPAFALHGIQPNPTRGEHLTVMFTLPQTGRARLEVFDVNGRQVLVREVGDLGAGQHSVDLAGGRRFAPGLYLVRLTQDAQSRTARAAVLD